MQFSTRPASVEPGYMGTWQQQNTDSNLLFRMSQQVSQPLHSSTHLSIPLFSSFLSLRSDPTDYRIKLGVKLMVVQQGFRLRVTGFAFTLRTGLSAGSKAAVCAAVGFKAARSEKREQVCK
ncbi:hypothetical protein SRHO_G00047940 [Serrasalmus rhombeus]